MPAPNAPLSQNAALRALLIALALITCAYLVSQSMTAAQSRTQSRGGKSGSSGPPPSQTSNIDPLLNLEKDADGDEDEDEDDKRNKHKMGQESFVELAVPDVECKYHTFDQAGVPIEERKHSVRCEVPAIELGIVIPLPPKQVNYLTANLHTWDFEELYPCQDSKQYASKTDIIFYMSRRSEDALKVEETLLNLMKELKSRECFNEILVRYTDMPKELDRYGAGTLAQFYGLFDRKMLNLKPYDYVLYMEPDTRPVRLHWAEKVYEASVTGHPFWSMGSAPRYSVGEGDYSSSKKMLDGIEIPHINGNALYRYNDPEYHRYVCDSRGAYGHYASLDNNMQAYRDQYRMFNVFHYFRFAEFIQNHPLRENIYRHEYEAVPYDEFMRESPHTYIVHGKMFVIEIDKHFNNTWADAEVKKGQSAIHNTKDEIVVKEDMADVCTRLLQGKAYEDFVQNRLALNDQILSSSIVKGDESPNPRECVTCGEEKAEGVITIDYEATKIAVIIPVVFNERDLLPVLTMLASWNRYDLPVCHPPRQLSKYRDLVFLISRTGPEKVGDKNDFDWVTSELHDRLGAARYCFDKVHFKSADVPKLVHAQGSHAVEQALFYASFDDQYLGLRHRHFSFSFFLTPYTRAIRPYFLDRLVFEAVRDPTFWMKGSAPRAFSRKTNRVENPIISGTSLYRYDDGLFRRYVCYARLVDDYELTSGRTQSFAEKLWLFRTQWHFWKLLHRFVHWDFVMDLNQLWRTDKMLNMQQIRRKHPNAFLVQGKHIARHLDQAKNLPYQRFDKPYSMLLDMVGRKAKYPEHSTVSIESGQKELIYLPKETFQQGADVCVGVDFRPDYYFGNFGGFVRQNYRRHYFNH